jgi:hypothetical protein
MSRLRSGLAFLAKAWLWLAVVWVFASLLPGQPIGWAILGTLVIAIPSMLVGLYGRVIRKTKSLSVYKESGWIYRLLSGNIIGVLFWSVLGIAAAWATLLRLSLAGRNDWLFLAGTAGLYWVAYRVMNRIMSRELKREYLIGGTSLRPARYIADLRDKGLLTEKEFEAQKRRSAPASRPPAAR